MNDTYNDTRNPIFETILDKILYLVLTQFYVFFIALYFRSVC
jgi:hypothetical protein